MGCSLVSLKVVSVQYTSLIALIPVILSCYSNIIIEGCTITQYFLASSTIQGDVLIDERALN